MFFSSKLKKYKDVKHCFFSRKNGVSKGYYESLNCGLGSRDEKTNVLKNLKFVSEKISCNEKFLITLNQKHSNQVIHFKSKKDIKNKLSGDAIVCEVKNIGIGILAADCAPILFYDPVKKIIGCAHAGWKGALRGVVKNIVKKFNELNSNVNDLIAIVGPCISKKSYEVEKDFFDEFIIQNKKNEIFFEINDDKKYFFDLRAYINNEISDLKIKNVENIDMDTFSNDEYFYSYRRSLLNKEKDYGRCISVILMT